MVVVGISGHTHKRFTVLVVLKKDSNDLYRETKRMNLREKELIGEVVKNSSSNIV